MRKKKDENELSEQNSEGTVKKKKWPRVLIAVLLILLLIIASAAIAGTIFFKKNFDYNYNDSLPSTPEELGFEEVKDDEIVNIALFGVDTSDSKSFKGRSDTIIIMSLNKTDKKVKLISVLRDTFTPIEKNGKTTYSKINSAYASGGPLLAIKTLNTDFDLDISEYVTVNFNGLVQIVDAMGGIEIIVGQNEISHINSGVANNCYAKGIDFEPYKITSAGKQLLCGMQVLQYARIRHTYNYEGTSNDYGRTDRQRYVLEQLFNKALSLEKSKYMGLIRAMMPYCETSLSVGQIMFLATDMMGDGIPQFAETRVPSTEYLMTRPSTNAGWVVYYDLNFAAKLIHSFIYKDITPEDYIAANGMEKYDWYRNGFVPPEIDDTQSLPSEETSSVTTSDLTE